MPYRVIGDVIYILLLAVNVFMADKITDFSLLLPDYFKNKWYV